MKRLLLLGLLGFLPAGTAATIPASSAREQANNECRSCHSDVAARHDDSLHARAFTDASFQKGFAKEPLEFCRNCHAPEGNPELGVACVTCHGEDAHATRAADFGTQSCARCHEFSFPHRPGLMQKTMTEHAGDSRECSSCHLRGHSFAVSRDPTMLRRALDVQVSRDDAQRAVFVLSSRNVGHAFPTGDLFRRLVLRVSSDQRTKPVEFVFGRSFRGETEVDDRRLAPSRRAVVGLPGALTWEVAYQRVTTTEQTPPFAADVEAETLIVSGRLP